MFNNIEPLDKKQHAKLKLNPVDGFKFASKVSHSFLGGTEVAEASKSFPVVFPQKSENNAPMLPMALLSLSKDENAFVTKDGKWKSDYIPKHLKRYPFIFASAPEKEDRFVVMIDKDAPQLNEKEGKPLFDENGEAKEIVTRIKDYLGEFQVDIVQTQKILSLLEQKDILVPKQFAITRGEKKKALHGFRVVDTKKLAELDDKTIVLWVKNGLMGIIYSHLNSLSNLRKVAAAQGASAE